MRSIQIFITALNIQDQLTGQNTEVFETPYEKQHTIGGIYPVK